jgi:fructoselysine 6-phosphate deglycase
MKEALNSDVTAALRNVEHVQFKHVFLVACGGSLSIMHPAKYLLDRYAVSFCSDVYNADEFVCRQPRQLGEDTLVILCSQTGTTRETVSAAKLARDLGATTIAMTVDPVSPLAAVADYAVQYRAHYTTGIPIDAADSNYSVIYMLLCGLLAQRGDADLVTPLLKSLPNLQAVIDRAKPYYASRGAGYAERFRSAPVIYTTAAGAAYGAAYSYATCVLMEMQWINSQAIHGNEFFHGPFEIVDKSACFIALIGLDETRRITERTRDFLHRFGDPANIMLLDAADLDWTGIEQPFRGLFAPLVFFDVLWAFAYQLAELRGQAMLEGRRYMKRITDY